MYDILVQSTVLLNSRLQRDQNNHNNANHDWCYNKFNNALAFSLFWIIHTKVFSFVGNLSFSESLELKNGH